mgnify:CR=1 FL=1
MTDKNVLNDHPEAEQGTKAETGKTPSAERPPSFFDRWTEILFQLGLGGSTLRVATNVLLLLAVVGVVFLMREFYQSVPVEAADLGDQANEVVVTPAVIEEDQALLDTRSRGVPRLAQIHTTIPSRPRVDVITYDVQEGDTVFAIAEQYGLDPQTVLWGNYNTLLDDPHNLRAGQELNILPVNGTYYEWQDGDGLNGVSEFFGVEPEAIIMMQHPLAITRVPTSSRAPG